MTAQKGLKVRYVYAPGSAVDGFVSGDTITVNLGNENSGFTTAVHETGHTMKKGNAQQWQAFETAMLRLAEKDAVFAAYAQQVRDAYTAQDSAARQSLLNADGTVNTQALNEEVSLKIAEQIVQDPQRIAHAVGQNRTLMQSFLDFVRGIKNSISIRLTNSQKAMLDEAERTLVNLLRGEASSVEGTRYSQTLQAQYDTFKSFEEQVDDVIKGRMPRRQDVLVGGTPEVLQKVGLNALPMTMTARHVQNAYNNTGNERNAHYHGLRDTLKQLPQALKNPIAVIQSETRTENSVVVLVDLTDAKGRTVIAPIRIDGFGNLNGVEIDANAITSVHGRNNAVTRLLKNALDTEAKGGVGVYYINKNKAASLSLAAGVQFPGDVHSLHGFIHKIQENQSPVNRFLENANQSKQFLRWFGDWKNNPEKASKIVDKNGNPLVMYHGTRTENGNFVQQGRKKRWTGHESPRRRKLLH